MIVNLNCDKCKEPILTRPFIYEHTIVTNRDTIFQRNYFFARISMKAVCYNCGNVIYTQETKEIHNKDIERIIWDEERV